MRCSVAGVDGMAEAVSTERKLAGLTQQQLAHAAHVSVSLVRSVEQGRVPASPAFIAAVARVFGMSVAELQGQPVAPRTPDDRRVKSVIPPLRGELASYRLPGDEQIRPRSLPELRAQVREVSIRRQQADLVPLGEELPALIAELRAFLTGAPQNGEAYSLLALLYAAAGQVAYKLGYPDLASLTTDRVEWAARRSGDELAAAAGDFYRAGEAIVATEWDSALRFLEQARSRIEHRLGDEAGLSLYGQLHLKSGLAAARKGDRSAADSHLTEAADLAARVGEFRNDYDLAFNRHNVSIWAVGLAVEMMDGTAAVDRAMRVRVSPRLPSERVGHHHIDLARAHLLHGDRARSFESLLNARDVAPQQTRYHPQVRETARLLAAAERRRSESLANFVGWLGIAA